MIRFLKISLILLVTTLNLITGQIESRVGSVSDYKIDKWYDIRIDSQVLATLTGLDQPKDGSFQFAVPVPVGLNPGNSGNIVQKGNETVWILGIRSKDAKSLNLILEPFNIPRGSYVYIYNSSKETIRGAFTDANNSSSGILATMPVEGEEIILEYHIPQGIEWKSTLGVSQVSHDYLGILGNSKNKDGRYNLSQACNIDINCPEGVPYSTEKRSVCRMIIRGVELCSGVLLNNTNQENTPLLLTAQHCIVNQNDADKTIFVFGYESPWCDGPDGRVTHSISGALLRSTNPDIDFSLVQLNTFPPIAYKPYFAGWDVSGNIPAHTISIHHPLGDVKKISIDNQPPVSGTFTGMPANSSWRILQWEGGTTEGGSSGAPLFDQNKRVAGILTGGEAICGRSVNDYFAKLSVLYNYSSLLYQQLKGWIDPAVTGVKQLNGRDPYAPNWLTADTLSNMELSEEPGVTKYSLPGTGYSTGFNSDSLTLYAEYFNNTAGHGISEVWLNLAKVNAVSTLDSVRVYVFADGAVPGTVLASQKIFIKEAKDSFILKLDFVNTVQVPGNFYIGWKIWYGNNALSESRQFAVFHSPDRIIPEKNTAWFNAGSGWKKFTEHPFQPMSVSLDVKVITLANWVINNIEDRRESDPLFHIYPNPASEMLVISSETELHDISVRIMDLTGNQLGLSRSYSIFQGEITLNIADLKPGMYLVNIYSAGIFETHKVLISR
jgi:lysyl endopeptidase